MNPKRKPDIREPEHKCIQTEYLARQNVILERSSNILFGKNGNPADGLAFQFKEFMSDHKRVVEDINTIKENINKAIESAGTAKHAVELFKAEEAGHEEAVQKQLIADDLKARIKKEVEDRDLIIANLKQTKKRDHWQRVMWIVMAVIAIGSLWGGLYFGFTKLKEGQASIKEDTKVTNEVLIPPGQTTRGPKMIIIDNDTTSTFK